MTPYPFLHFAIVDRVIGGPHAVQIRGGRGVGKSVVLGAIAKNLNVDSGRIVEGRSGQTAEGKLSEIAAGDGPVLIDDLDEMFSDTVHALLSRLLTARRRMIVTSTLPPDVSLLVDTKAYHPTRMDWTLLRSWSDFTTHFQSEIIDPWPSNWHNRTNEMVWQVLDPRCRDENLLGAEWTTAVVQLTGGHPTLLDPALKEVKAVHGPERAGAEDVRVRPDLASIERRRQVYEHLEEALFSSPAFRRVRRVAKDMETTAPDAHKHLVANAARNEVDFDAPVEYRRVLTDSGLVYRSPQSKRLVVAGELLRRTLGGANRAQRPVVRFISNDPERGMVSVALGGRVSHVDLRGKTWKIAKTLHRHANHAVPVSTLMKDTDLDHAGVRSAIQRLKGEFAAAGVEGLIENVWGEGYRLCDFPLIATTSGS